MAKHLYVAARFGAIYDIVPTDGSIIRTVIDFNTISLTGLVYDPFDGYFWAVTRSNSTSNPSSLVRVNMSLGEITVIGALGLPGGKSCSDITVASGGLLYGISAGPTPKLVTINKSTGVATTHGAGNASTTGGCCEIISGVMYYWGQRVTDDVYTINLSTGVFTSIGATTRDPDYVNAASYNSDDGLTYINTNYPSGELAIFDFGSRVMTDIPGYIRPDDIDAIAWGPLVSFTPTIIPAPTIYVDHGWFVDHLNHGGSVQQTYKPQNLHFVKRISAVQDADWEVSNSAVDIGGDLVVYRDIPTDEDMVKPWANMFQLRKMVEGVETKILAGFITNTNGQRGRDKTKISGKDWSAYLDRRQVPYDPFAPTAYRFGPTVNLTVPRGGMSYSVMGRDLAIIVKDILTAILARPNSLSIDLTSIAAIGTTINFELQLGDTSTALSIIDGLSQYFPGFDYLISYDKVMNIWSPHRFGDPDTTADDGAMGGNICWRVGDIYGVGHEPMEVEYTNSGPTATHLLGRGAGSNNQTTIAKALGASDIQGAFWRLDGAVDFGDQAKTQGVVDMRTRKEFIYGAQEGHDIILKVNPDVLTDFWNIVRPGLALWINEDFQFHGIDSAQRIMEMDCTVDNEENERVTFGLNQIYNTSTHYGVSEG